MTPFDKNISLSEFRLEEEELAEKETIEFFYQNTKMFH